MKHLRAFTLVELLVVLVIMMMIVGIFIPPHGSPAREAGRRQACMESVRQITKAVLKYESEHGPLPATILDKEDKPLYSWRVVILPYLDKECREIYKKIRLDEPWDSEHNRTIKSPAMLRCQSSDCDEFSASYVLIVDRKQNDDGLPSPVVAEILPEVPWMQPIDLSLTDIAGGPKWVPYNDPTLRFGSHHPGLAMLGMSNGNAQPTEVCSQENQEAEVRSTDDNDHVHE